MKRFLGFVAACLIAPSTAFAAMDATVPADNEAIGLGASRIREVKQYILRQYKDVIDFGADSTGVTSSTTAIQAAIDAVQTNGGKVFAPPGTYSVCNLKTYPGVRITGGGKGSTGVVGATIFRNDCTSGEPTVYQTSAASGVPAVEIDHIKFTLGTGKTSGPFISLQRCTGAHIHHNHFQGWSDAALVTAPNAAIFLSGCNGSTIEQNQFYGYSTGGVGRAAIRLDDTSPSFGNAGNVIRGNNINEVQFGIWADSLSDSTIEENLIEDSSFHMLSAIYLSCSISGSARNKITRNRIEGPSVSTDSTIVLEDTSHNIIEDNHIASTSRGVTIRKNTGVWPTTFNALIRGTYHTASYPVYIASSDVADTLIEFIIPNYAFGAAADIYDMGTRTVRLRHDTGFGTSFAGTGYHEVVGLGVRHGYGVRTAYYNMTADSTINISSLLGLTNANTVGILTITNTGTSRSAQYELQGGLNAVAEIVDLSNGFSDTKDNNLTVNIYSDGGVYTIQNKTGLTRMIHLSFLGF